MLDFLTGKQKKWLVNKVNYGFVSGGGVEKAVSEAINQRAAKPWVFKTDITKFFDLINRDLLRAKLKALVRQTSAHPLLLSAIACEVIPTRRSEMEKLSKLGIKPGRGVRQGMPLSPFFANLFLADFDRESTERGIPMLRYADDLICFASTRREVRS